MLSGKALWRDGVWLVKLDQEANFEHIQTINSNQVASVPVEIEFTDPRKARPKQRALFFALLGDIHNWSGEPTEWLKEYFYTLYTIKTAGRVISLANDTQNTVSDARKLIDQVVDFIFEFDVPIKQGYELLPRDENSFQYECIRHRKCLICGKHADIHHLELNDGNAVGMGMDRTKVDHSKRWLVALCRRHHQEIHETGTKIFCTRHHLTSIGIKVDADTLKKIGVRGNYGEID